MIRTIAAAALAVCMAGSALAQTAPPLAKGAMKVCRPDEASLCAGVARGKPMHQCIKANFAKLSPACQQAVTARKEAKKAAKRAAKAGIRP